MAWPSAPTRPKCDGFAPPGSAARPHPDGRTPTACAGDGDRSRTGRGQRPKGWWVMAYRKLTEAERAERRQADRDRLEQAARALLSSEGWQRWVRVRSTNGLSRYSFGNQLLIAMQRVVSHCLLGRGWVDIQSSGVQCRRADCDRWAGLLEVGALPGVVGPSVTRVCRARHGSWPPDFRSRAGCVWGGTGPAPGGPTSGGL